MRTATLLARLAMSTAVPFRSLLALEAPRRPRLRPTVAAPPGKGLSFGHLREQSARSRFTDHRHFDELLDSDAEFLRVVEGGVLYPAAWQLKAKEWRFGAT